MYIIHADPPSRFPPRLLRFYLLVLIAFTLCGLAGCYVPFHRVRDLEPEYFLVGDWRVKARIGIIPVSNNAYVEINSWHDSADTTRIPLHNEILVADEIVVEYVAEEMVLRAGVGGCRFNYRYDLEGLAWDRILLTPVRGNYLLARLSRCEPDRPNLVPIPSFSDTFLTEGPIFSCHPVKTLLLGAQQVSPGVDRLDSLRIEPWDLPAPSSFSSIWKSREFRQPHKNGPIRISFRIRIYDLQTCKLLQETGLTENQERHTEWDWYMGN